MADKFDRTDDLMGVIHRALRRSYDRQLKSFGLTPCQFEILMTLWEEDGIVLTELGRRVSRDGPTITGVIDRMEKKLLVRRKEEPRDRRRVRVVLTPKGKKMKDQLYKTKKMVFKKLFNNLTSSDLTHLDTILMKMVKNMEREEVMHG